MATTPTTGELAALSSPRKYERHTFLPGERVHFRTEAEIAAGLTDGYLELEMLFEGPSNTSHHRVVRKGTLNGYYQTEAEIGKTEGAVNRFFDTLEELMQRIDLHAYKWYPLWGDSRFHYPDKVNPVEEALQGLEYTMTHYSTQ